jgi:phospholipid/cholesterol/gamma-HCH transport system ATP-binding protein
LYEESDLPADKIDARVAEVLGFVGLNEFIDRMPSELSGGQRRRVAIARAMAAKPGLLLYDEATTGLDPITAISVDEEMVKLRDLENVSSIIVTHQLRDAFYIATHRATSGPQGVVLSAAPPETMAATEFLMLRDGRVAFEGSADELQQASDEYLRAFVSQTVTH